MYLLMGVYGVAMFVGGFVLGLCVAGNNKRDALTHVPPLV